MPDTEQHTPGPVDSLIADARIIRKKIKDNPPTTVEQQNVVIKDEILPMIIAALEQIVEIDEVVLEMSEQQDSFIQPELASQIFQTVALGAQVLEEARNLLPEMSDIAKKRVEALLNEFEHSMELTVMGVSSATVDPGDDEEDDSDEETNPGDEDEDETPIENPMPIAAESETQDPPTS